MGAVSCWVVWVGVTYSVRADTLNHPLIWTPILFPILHMVVRLVMDSATFFAALIWLMHSD